MTQFKDKTLLITGGTGSFGNAVLNRFLETDIKDAIAAGISRFHIDIMDGHFVPNLSFGPQLVEDFKREFPMTDAEIHLMSDAPDKLVPAFVSAGADLVELHYEAMDKPKLYYWFDYLASNGVDAALAISPDTPVEVVEPYLPLLKQVLVMTVKPGFGGQSFLPESVSRIKSVREIVGSDFDIEVDGGINDQTIKLAENAGANIFVVGSYLYENGDVGSQVHKLEKIIK